MRGCMSTHTLQPLIWLARRWISSRVRRGRPDFSTAAPRACSASIAPGTTNAGCFIRACMTLSPFCHYPDVREPGDVTEGRGHTLTFDNPRSIVERQGMATNKTDLLQGTLDMLVLQALRAGA